MCKSIRMSWSYFFWFLGGALGGAFAAYSASGKFKSVGEILLEMDEEKKQLLYTKATAIINNVGPQDIVALTAFVVGNPAIKQQLMGTVVDHVHNQLKMEIIDWLWPMTNFSKLLFNLWWLVKICSILFLENSG